MTDQHPVQKTEFKAARKSAKYFRMRILPAAIGAGHSVTCFMESSFIVLNQVQNGVAVYATWGTLSTLLNLTIYLQHQTETLRCDCAMLSLMLMLMELLVW